MRTSSSSKENKIAMVHTCLRPMNHHAPDAPPRGGSFSNGLLAAIGGVVNIRICVAVADVSLVMLAELGLGWFVLCISCVSS